MRPFLYLLLKITSMFTEHESQSTKDISISEKKNFNSFWLLQRTDAAKAASYQ